MPNASLSNARDRSRFRSWLAQDITGFRRLRAQFGFGPLRRADVAAKLGEDGALEDSLGRIYEPLPLPARGWKVVHFFTSGGGRMYPPDVDESVLVPQAGSLLRAYAAAEHAYQLDAISSAEEAGGLARMASCDFDMEGPFGSPFAPPVDESPV